MTIFDLNISEFSLMMMRFTHNNLILSANVKSTNGTSMNRIFVAICAIWKTPATVAPKMKHHNVNKVLVK